jgi:predicted ATP-dependent serine protease
VANPSALFLAERPREAPGSVVLPTLEGTRPILVELQALVSASGLAMPRRQALGIDPARLSLLSAVLEKKVGLRLYDRDVFVNVAGGIKVVEPAADLGVIAAMASSYHDRPWTRPRVSGRSGSGGRGSRSQPPGCPAEGSGQAGFPHRRPVQHRRRPPGRL